MRSRTRSSSGPWIDAANRSRAASGGRPPIASCGRPANSSSSAGSRTANTSPTASAPSRRATNPRVCADARSSHCASSITQTTGSLGRGLGQQTEHGQAQQEAFRRGACPQTERYVQRVTLRARDAVETVQQRGAQLMQAWRRRARSPLAHRSPGSPGTGTPHRSGTPAAQTCRSRPHPAAQGPGSCRSARRPPGDRAPGIRSVDPAACRESNVVAPGAEPPTGRAALAGERTAPDPGTGPRDAPGVSGGCALQSVGRATRLAQGES